MVYTQVMDLPEENANINLTKNRNKTLIFWKAVMFLSFITWGLFSYTLYFGHRAQKDTSLSKVNIVNQDTQKIEMDDSQVSTSTPPPNSTASTPAPLRVNFAPLTSTLSVAGVIQYTNQHRAENGLAPLVQNSKLDVSALIKAKDMLDNQYFEHESPTGVGAGDLAASVGYSYLLVGENLALGGFASDTDLVQGWMNSPGHRANILNSEYSDIGVSVLRGTFEGHEVWFGVQHFGRPLSECILPSEDIKNAINANEARLDVLSSELDVLEAYLNSSDPTTQEYANKVNEYNGKVNEYNALLEETKGQINSYNTQASDFNICAGIN